MQKTVREVGLGEERLSYTLIRKKIKNMHLRVLEDGRVCVSCGAYFSDREADAFVLKNWEYIEKRKNRNLKMKEVSVFDLQLVEGEELFLLGKKVRLRLSQNAKESVLFQEDQVVLSVKDPSDFSRKEKVFYGGLLKFTKKELLCIVEQVYPLFSEKGVAYPQVSFRNMRTRWGSCAPSKGKITLNTRLIMFPIEAIEYVVVHEYAHFLQPNHSKVFYAVVSQILPDWKLRKRMLRTLI